MDFSFKPRALHLVYVYVGFCPSSDNTFAEVDPKAPFLIAITLSRRGGHFSVPWIALLYPSSVPYNAEC